MSTEPKTDRRLHTAANLQSPVRASVTERARYLYNTQDMQSRKQKLVL